MNSFVTSRRLNSIPPYVFASLETMKAEVEASGKSVIDLGLGDPDFPTQQDIVAAMKESLDRAENLRYPTFRGEFQLREEITRWYKACYNVTIDPDKEVLVLIGSKEGIAHIPLAYLNKGDYALVPDPGYPAYRSAVLLAEGIPHALPLHEGNNYLPDLDTVPMRIRAKSKLLYLNYPNNPTTAIATTDFFSNAIDFARRNNILICHDFAYSEIIFDGEKASSFLSFPHAIDHGVEFHSFSKTFAMTGWRLGFVAGNKDVITALGKLKSCIDSGVFKAIQFAGVAALRSSSHWSQMMIEEYTKRRALLSGGLSSVGFRFRPPKATYYFWVKVPQGFKSSLSFTKFLLKEKGIMVTPGIGFGQYGDGFFRISMNVSLPTIQEALRRLKQI